LTFADELLDFIKYSMKAYNPDLVERCHISRTLMQKTIKFWIWSALKESIIKNWRIPHTANRWKFRYFWRKVLSCITVLRYLNAENLPITKLLSLGNNFTKKSEIYNNEEKLKSNLIGFTTDNGSDLISGQEFEVNSEGSGLVNRIKKNFLILFTSGTLATPEILIVIDDGLKEFPVYIINFIKKICAYFAPG